MLYVPPRRRILEGQITKWPAALSLAIPKNGSTTLDKLLRCEPYNAYHIGTWPCSRHSMDMFEEYVNKPQDVLFKYCICRNPFRRFISLWRHCCHYNFYKWQVQHTKGKSLKQFAKWILGDDTRPDHYWAFTQLAWLEGKRGLKERGFSIRPIPEGHSLKPFVPHRILRIENYQEDFNKLPFVEEQVAKMPRASWGPVLKEYDETWKDFYDPYVRNLVREYYAEDFEFFGYPTSLSKAV